jgi:ABC-type lipoprotein release transport system permease subunit
MDQIASDYLWILGMLLRITMGMTAVALLLSLAGIYAVLSFAVARRTREIGVRVTLGANRRRVITGIFRRPLPQVGLGVGAGATLIAVGALALSRTTQFATWPSGPCRRTYRIGSSRVCFRIAACNRRSPVRNCASRASARTT